MLSFKEIKDLIDLVAERGLSALEVEQTGFRIRIEGARPAGDAAPAVAPTLPLSVPAAASAFYRAPSPEADPFAEVGQKVSKGKTLCIIESMKLMNEIESDVEGEIAEVYPRNGQPVEYGEKLFAIRLAA
jgi:acetyl-CoA carboxylase biotin carboxyl carrier protein